MLASPAATIFLWSSFVLRMVRGAAEALFEGFWMGILSESALDIISQKSYGKGEQYTAPSVVESGLYFWEDLIVDKFFRPGCTVLVGAAGGGREIVGLARAGFIVDGFECSRPMVAAGQALLASRGIAARLEWAPPCTAPALDKVYDALVVGWNGYTYISPRARRIEFMRTLRRSLAPGAPVVVSCALRAGRSRSAVWTPRVANLVRRCTFRTPVFEAGDRFPGRPRHEFTPQQLQKEMTDAGFSPIAFYRWGPFGAIVCLAQQSDAQ